ncbi:MAG: hypothetical protein GVY35_01875 [Bacteroidetes bacterium]|jgi:hypothetical protein|nr:hypothetical protein [Bacteroidota bacterium]
MLKRFAALIGSVMVVLALVIGCDSDLPTASRTTAFSDADDNWSTARIYSGLDSFGVAVNVKGEGSVAQEAGPEGLCAALSGSGHGTHLGPTDIELTHCTEDEAVTRSTFRFTGKHGRFLSGWYKGSSTSNTDGTRTFETTFAITDGELPAVKTPIEQVTDQDGNQLWNGTLTGTIEDGQFSIEVDGKVLQHVNEDGNEDVEEGMSTGQ